MTDAEKAALHDILYRFHLGDMVYEVRERCDLSELSEDQSSWDHPDVVRFGECVETLKAMVPQETPND